MNISILDLNKHMSKILAALDMNETIKLAYRGEEKAVIVPTTKHCQVDVMQNPAFGLWADRKKTDDVENVMQKIRQDRITTTQSGGSA